MKNLLFPCFALLAIRLFGQSYYYPHFLYSPKPEHFAGVSSCGLLNPVMNTFTYRAPAFYDWDKDGLIDLFFGREDGQVAYFRNVGTAAYPCFEWVTDSFGELDVPIGNAAPFVADLNADGKPDFVIGNGFSSSVGGILHYFRGVGTVESPEFELMEDTLAGYDISDSSVPFLIDADNDGDLDIFVGDGYGRINYIENTGNAQVPKWASTFPQITDVGWRAAPQVVNIQGNARLELVSAESYGTLRISTDISQIADTIIFQTPFTQFTNIDACAATGGCWVRAAFADLNGDTLLDLLITSNGAHQLYFNTGTASTPVFDPVSAMPLPINSKEFPAAFTDLDNDGKLEMYAPQQGGKVRAYENIGTPVAPLWALIDEDFLQFTTTYAKTLAFGDINSDSLTDVIVGFLEASTGRKMQVFLNNGSPTDPQLEYTPSPSLENYPFYTTAIPILIDLYKDGKMDLLVSYNTLLRFVNSSDNGTDWVPDGLPMFPNGLSGLNFTFGDVDGDGDTDAIRSQYGSLDYLENLGSDVLPQYAFQPYALEDLSGNFATLVDLTSECGLEIFLDHQFWVYRGIKPAIQYVSQTNLCSNAQPKKLTAKSEGGWWEGADSEGYFYPEQGAGAYLVIYHYPDKWGCFENTDSVWLYVTPAPNAEIATVNGTPLTSDTVWICINAAPITIAPLNSCGYFSGQIFSTGIFNPTYWGLGTKTIAYYCNQNSCSDRDTIYVVVTPPATTTINQLNGNPITGNSVSFCKNAGPQTLSATPAGGVFGGVASPQGVIDPASLAPGTYQATYTVEQNGCTATHTISVTVKPLPNPNISKVGNMPLTGDSIVVCKLDTTFVLTPVQLGGVFTPSNSFNPADLPPGPNPFQYTISQNGCSTSSTLNVFIQPFPDASIALINGDSLVSDTIWTHIDSDSIVLTPAQSGGVFSGTTDPGGVVVPAKLGKGAFTIIYSLGENGCSASSKLVIIIETVGTNEVLPKKDSLNFTVVPNPTSGAVTFSLNLTQPASANLSLYASDGHLVHSFFAGRSLSSGHHIWDLSVPEVLPRGHYWAIVQVGGHTTKVLLILQ